MFSQADGGSVGAFEVYKDPIEDQLDLQKPTATHTLCNAAPLADASNIIKQTRLIHQKGDSIKTHSLIEEKQHVVTKPDTIQHKDASTGYTVATNTLVVQPSTVEQIETKPVERKNIDKTGVDINVAESLQEISNVETEVDKADVANDTENPALLLTSDTHNASPLEQDKTSNSSSNATCNDSQTPRAPEVATSQDSQDFGDDIEFDSQMLQKIHDIENKINAGVPSEKALTSKEFLAGLHEEPEDDFGPDIDPDVLERIECNTNYFDGNSTLIAPGTPIESYEEIKTWLGDFDGIDDMFDVDFDGQLLDLHSSPTTTSHSSAPQSPVKTSLESLLRSSELDTQKILSEVENITNKYGGFTTGSKKPLATAISSEAVANLFEPKPSTKKSSLHKNLPLRPSSRTAIPVARPRFGGFVNARTSSPLRASESAKRKAAKAFGQDGELLYQINDTNTSPSNEDASPQSIKSQRLTTTSD
ncbi:unnamed protein product [Umbelopsis vinacea]